MSPSWLPYAVREDELRRLESRLASDPNSVELLLARALLLTGLGRVEEAKSTYLHAVTLAPTNFTALNDFGNLLHETGYRSAAATLFRQAIAHHPNNPAAYTNLGNVCYTSGDLREARRCYEQALAIRPAQHEAHRGLSYVLRDLGDDACSRTHRNLGFQGDALIARPYRGKHDPIRVLELVSAAGGNAAIDPFLDDATFLSTVIVAEYFGRDAPLPAHDLVVNAVADADLCGEALHAAERILQATVAAVVNHPRAVLATSRAGVASSLAAIANVVAPKTVTLSRDCLGPARARQTLGEHGLELPLLLRALGFHTGQHFERIERLDDLQPVLARLPGETVTLIEFLDARGADGRFRKYRVMMIDGALYPLHLAISRDWKVHYFTADMADNAAHRAEDEAFLTNMERALREKAIVALAAIQKALDLEYAGIDFGLGASGEVLLFEANAAMNVVPPGPDARWNYRRPHVRRIQDATRQMLLRRSGR